MTHNHRPGALALDIQATQNVASGERGTARYVTNHAQALMKVPEAVTSLLLNPLLPLPGHLPADLLASPLLDWNTATTFSRIAASGPIAYHIMSPFELDAPASTVVPAHIVENTNVPLWLPSST
jgi:hypothetical protein